MATVAQHYAEHLGPIYLWMAGGADAALRAGSEELAALNLPRAAGDHVVDLGAGFGMHAIPLARRGARVLAIDTSRELLGELARLGGDLPIRTVVADLAAFARHLDGAPTAILCMGDTLTHLSEPRAVDALCAEVAAALAPGGVFVATFRDYTVPLAGDQRFVPVRSDEARILTCFLDYGPATVMVHDLVHERTAAGWQTRVSHYPKLRLSPDHVVATLRSHGLEARRETGVRGMVRLVASKT